MKVNSLVLAVAAVAVANLTTMAVAAEGEAAAKAEESAQPPKKLPKRDAEYANWDRACAVSEAWGLPIVAFGELKGDKATSRIRGVTVGQMVFKDFVKENCILYRFSVPQEPVRQQRGMQRQKNETPKPDLKNVKKSEQLAVNKICGGSKSPAFPAIAVLSPGGSRVVGTVVLSPEEASFSKFMAELKDIFESNKYEFNVPKKVQKILDDEAKKRAAEEKRNKKN